MRWTTPDSLFLVASALLTSCTTAYKTVSEPLVLRRSTASEQPSSRALRAAYGEANLYSTGYSFLADISFGTQSFIAIIDTGSSDTWLAATGFTCVDYLTNEPIPEAACYFGPTYTIDQYFTQIPNQNFNLSYGSGEFLNGIVGYDSVTFAGIQVPSQEVALATLTGWQGDGVSSGLIGLAYPGLTSSYPGTNPSADDFCSIGETDCNSIFYSSLLNTIFFVDALTDPIMSLAISRDASASSAGGVLALGGVPDASDPTINATSGITTSTPVEYLPGDNQFRYYTIAVDGLVYPSAPVGAGVGADQYIVDSGTTLNYFQPAEAAAFNALFNPPAYINQSIGYYYVDCNPQSIPTLGIEINGVVLYTNPVDLVSPNGDGTCVSGVQVAGDINILGDVFLNNVLAVFDLGQEIMEFTSRIYYES